MTTPNSVLQIDSVRTLLSTARGRIDLHAVAECESTSTVLLQMAKAGAPAGTVLCADCQTRGRGRRGRVWHQAEQGLAFSLLWRLPATCAADALSLAVGLAVAESLGEAAQLKWPNDVLLADRKVAGVLIESPQASCYMIGIGINLASLSGLPDALQSQAACVEGAQREFVLAQMLNNLVSVLDEFAAQGFVALHARWMARHAFQGREVSVAELALHGCCHGVNESGALLIEADGQMHALISGDVSVRVRVE